MVKRNTNFKQVYLVDKHLLNIQKGYQYLPKIQHFDDFKVDRSLNTSSSNISHSPVKNLQPFQNSNTNNTSVNVHNSDTQTTNFHDLSIPNEYFLNDSFTQTNSGLSHNFDTQTTNFDDFNIPNEYFLNDSSTQTGGLSKDSNTQTEFTENVSNSQNNGKDKNNVQTQTEVNQQPYYLTQRIIPTKKSYICQLCNQLFNNPKSFSNHLKIHKEQIKISRLKSKTHPKSKDNRPNDTLEQGGDRRSNQSYHLKLNKNVASAKKFVDGRNIHERKDHYLCQICNIKLRTYSSLKSHVKSLHRSLKIRYDFPNNSKYAAIASIDYDVANANPSNQAVNTTTDIEMYEDSLLGNINDSDSMRNYGPLRVRNDIETSAQFGDNSNIMGPTNIRYDIGTQSNFEDDTNIMGPVSIRRDIGNSSGFENNSNIMGHLKMRKNMTTSTNLEDNSNIMGPINIRNELGNPSNFGDNSNVMDASKENKNGDEINGGDKKESKDVSLVEDLQTYWCTKCEQFFRNFNSLKDHLHTKHNQVAILSKRSKTKEKVKRKLPFYSKYN